MPHRELAAVPATFIRTGGEWTASLSVKRSSVDLRNPTASLLECWLLSQMSTNSVQSFPASSIHCLKFKWRLAGTLSQGQAGVKCRQCPQSSGSCRRGHSVLNLWPNAAVGVSWQRWQEKNPLRQLSISSLSVLLFCTLQC